ncbi:MAG: aminotransferase class I/II-fold pyridoxal phosphate-dependent enzyme, partial [Gammaproteobacteria bacterium]
KLHGLAALRIGYAVSHPEAADMLNRVKLPFNISSTAMIAVIAAFGDHEHIEATLTLNQEGMQYLKEELAKMHITFLPPAGNFMTIDIAQDGVNLYQALLREGVIVRPLVGYGLPTFLRVSIGTMAENQRFITSLRKVLCHPYHANT